MTTAIKAVRMWGTAMLALAALAAPAAARTATRPAATGGTSAAPPVANGTAASDGSPALGSALGLLGTDTGERQVLAIGSDSTLTSFSWLLGGTLTRAGLGTLGTSVAAATSFSTDDGYDYVATAAPAGAITLIGWAPGIAGSTTGQTLTSVPGAAALTGLESPGGTRQLFVLTRTGLVRELSVVQGQLAGQATVARLGAATSAITAFTGTDGTEHLAALSRSGLIRVASFAPTASSAGDFTPLTTLPGTTTLSGLVSANGSEDLFALGSTGTLTDLALDPGGAAPTSTQLAPAVSDGGRAVAAFATSNGCNHVAMLSRNGTVRTVWWTPGQAASPKSATLGTATGASALAALG